MITRQKGASSSCKAGLSPRLWKGCFGFLATLNGVSLLQELDSLLWSRACRISQSLKLFLAWLFAALWGIQHLEYFCKQQQPGHKVWSLVCWWSPGLSQLKALPKAAGPHPAASASASAPFPHHNHKHNRGIYMNLGLFFFP